MLLFESLFEGSSPSPTAKLKTMKTEVYTDLEIKEFAAIGEELRPESDYMADWVFHYNPYNQLWNAIPRNIYNEYWSNSQHHALSSRLAGDYDNKPFFLCDVSSCPAPSLGIFQTQILHHQEP
jgi:hypothetical protein